MRRQVKRGRGLPTANSYFRYVRIPVWVVLIVLLTAILEKLLPEETLTGRLI